MNDYCKGCYSYYLRNYRHHCSYLRYNPNAECPCSICIIKVMCTTPCSDFLIFNRPYRDSLVNVNTKKTEYVD